MALSLRSSTGAVIDQAGDGGPPFFGGRVGDRNHSMERRSVTNPGDGTDRGNWQRCGLSEGGTNVVESFRSKVIASPGEKNSGS